MSVNHAYIEQFVAEHGHAPWVSCGDAHYECYKADTCKMDKSCPGWVDCRLADQP